jgi:hypothetical protein
MNYCALEDAYQPIDGAPESSDMDNYATKAARKEERRKARKCKGPAGTFLGVNDVDPDRQNLRVPSVPAMNQPIGLRQHEPVTADQGTLEPFLPKNDMSQPATAGRLNVEPIMTDGLKSTERRKKFFGADPTEDTVFADYMPEQPNYQLQPDFMKAFDAVGLGKASASSSSALPNPSVNMYWKPLTNTGAQTSFIEQLPPPGGKYYKSNQEISMQEVMSRMDKIFARLDDMSHSSPEQMTSEVLMFISTGIFVMFLMDLLVKKGGKIRF